MLHEHTCDKTAHCADLSDELDCGADESLYINDHKIENFGPRAFINTNRFGRLTPKTVFSDDFVCPAETHFWCPGHELCLPIFLRCNAVCDCPGREDEAGCEGYTCPGYYRCRGPAASCLPPAHLCDGVFHCPQRDDELLCHFNCTLGCTCYGHAFFCRDVFPAAEFPELRFLDGGDSGLTPADLVNNTMLVHLSLARCGLAHLSRMAQRNLLFLDLSYNMLQKVRIEHIFGVKQLKILLLTGNPLTFPFFGSTSTNMSLSSLLELDLSEVNTKMLNMEAFGAFPNLEFLNLTNGGVDRVLGEGFQSLEQLRVLDLRGCPVTQFPRDVFQGLGYLQAVYADNYKLCCPATLPQGFNVANCRAPDDVISSCDALLGSPVFRTVTSLSAVMALTGNLASVVYHLVFRNDLTNTIAGVFLRQLCVSDFLTGVYLAIVAVADLLYRGRYAWEDAAWRHSAVCGTAGFLALLSRQVSAFSVFLITADGVTAVLFPLSWARFSGRAAGVVCVLVWFCSVLLAALPLLPGVAHWRLYGRTGLCTPLPLADHHDHDHSHKQSSPGRSYVLGVAVVVLNSLVLTTLTGAGQVALQRAIHVHHHTTTTTTTTTTSALSPLSSSATATATATRSTHHHHSLLARRLVSVVVTGGLCWFFVGLLGLLTWSGVPVPGGVSVATAVFVLPASAALGPFLYAYSLLGERRRTAREARVKKMIVSRMKADKLNA